MKMRIRARHLPARITSGAFILNSGIEKMSADDETAAHLHKTATSTYPFLAKLTPQQFARLLAAGEIGVGAALLAPFVPAAVAGAGLTAFSGALLGLYVRTPGMRKEGSIFPTHQGIPLAKDSWMLGMGLSLVADGITDRSRRRKH
jgi:hypothetical protein